MRQTNRQKNLKRLRRGRLGAQDISAKCSWMQYVTIWTAVAADAAQVIFTVCPQTVTREKN